VLPIDLSPFLAQREENRHTPPVPKFRRRHDSDGENNLKSLRLTLPLLVVALLFASFYSATAAQQATPAPTSSAARAPAAAPQDQQPQKVTKYTLPPERYKKARDLARIGVRFRLFGLLYGLAVLWLLLRWKFSARYRSIAEGASSARFLQAAGFTILFFLTLDLLHFPLAIYRNSILREYGFSIQSWGSWFWDWTKGQLISLIPAVILTWILYAVIRKSPRRWWFYFWLASLPIALLLVFLQPLIVDPLFHKFEPLAQRNPALTTSLEKMVERAGQDIPPERMFWMGAGEKTTELNAYVTGFGASKRIVVWDTTIAKMTTPQITYVAGHEMGHYVLQHLPKGVAFGAALALFLFYLGYRSIGWVLSHWGSNWGVRALDDWASLPALLILSSVFTFLASPIVSTFTRYGEHQADQYGLEVTHGLTPDSGQVAAQSFQILGEVDLDDPDPNAVQVFLFYSHPPIRDRIQFALTYDPWSAGRSGEFVH
jgi:Zn-dependent protease with chaperone function